MPSGSGGDHETKCGGGNSLSHSFALTYKPTDRSGRKPGCRATVLASGGDGTRADGSYQGDRDPAEREATQIEMTPIGAKRARQISVPPLVPKIAQPKPPQSCRGPRPKHTKAEAALPDDVRQPAALESLHPRPCSVPAGWADI